MISVGVMQREHRVHKKPGEQDGYGRQRDPKTGLIRR